MKIEDGWWFPDGEAHLPIWMADPRVRMILNGRPAYQGAKQRAALDLCTKRRVAVDVGAHVGLWSFNLAHHFRVVHAFEPVAAHRACFERNVLESIETPNVILYPYALGKREGQVSIRTEPTSSGDSRVDGPGEIQMRTLDSFDFQDVDLLKIDAEGYELFILRGAEELLASHSPVIVVEQKRGHASRYGLGDKDAVVWLQSKGYRVAREISGDFLMIPT